MNSENNLQERSQHEEMESEENKESIHPGMQEEEKETLTCPRCGYCTDRRSNMKKHLLKRIPCEPVLLDIDRQDIQAQSPHLLAKPLKGGPKTFTCTACKKQFNKKYGLSLHTKNHCRGDLNTEITITKRFQKLEHDYQVLQKKMEDLLVSKNEDTPKQMIVETNSHNTNCNNTVNNKTVNNTVIINAFRKEDVTHLIEDQQFMAKPPILIGKTIQKT